MVKLRVLRSATAQRWSALSSTLQCHLLCGVTRIGTHFALGEYSVTLTTVASARRASTCGRMASFGDVTHSKTTGADKKVSSRPLCVSSSAFVACPGWLAVTMAPGHRDYFLPSQDVATDFRRGSSPHTRARLQAACKRWSVAVRRSSRGPLLSRALDAHLSPELSWLSLIQRNGSTRSVLGGWQEACSTCARPDAE